MIKIWASTVIGGISFLCNMQGYHLFHSGAFDLCACLLLGELLGSPRQSKTLPKAQRTRGLSSYYRISIKHQLQIFNQTSASQLNLKLKSWPNLASEYWPRFNFVTSSKHQRQNVDQTSASKSRLNFIIKILTKPCAQSLDKSLVKWLHICRQLSQLLPNVNNLFTALSSRCDFIKQLTSFTDIKFTKQQLVSFRELGSYKHSQWSDLSPIKIEFRKRKKVLG